MWIGKKLPQYYLLGKFNFLLYQKKNGKPINKFLLD